ncbi:MAG: hypothetical protein WCP45_05940 [Verrucomicrobiota bacterium]
MCESSNARCFGQRRSQTAATMLLYGLAWCAVAQAAPLVAGDLRISPESRELIIRYETGGMAEYNATLQHPEVPPGASGITIGIGYDLGYNTPNQIAADWSGVLPAPQVARLQSVAGKTGAAARAALVRVKDIRVPWEAALKVYETRTVPRFARDTVRAYPGVLNLPNHMQGVMLSTSFNRGTAFSPYDRRRELVWSRDDIAAGRIARLPSYQLQMRRLWPSVAGLQRRYAAHAGLMQRDLDSKNRK